MPTSCPALAPAIFWARSSAPGCVPTVCLNEIFRQAKRSLIVENAHHIIEGQMPIAKGRARPTTSSFWKRTARLPASGVRPVTTRLPRSYGFDPVRDIQVLCPTKLGPTGTQALNVELQTCSTRPEG